MKRSGFADLPLHGGRVPPWLAERMEKLGTAIVESIVHLTGRAISLAAQRSVLVSGARLRDGHGLAFFRHYDFRDRRAETGLESAGA